MKIKRKPWPIGNVFKNICDGQLKIVLHIEFYGGKELMRDKDYVTEFGATTATCLRLSRHWTGSGRIWVADSWFGGSGVGQTADDRKWPLFYPTG